MLSKLLHVKKPPPEGSYQRCWACRQSCLWSSNTHPCPFCSLWAQQHESALCHTFSAMLRAAPDKNRGVSLNYTTVPERPRGSSLTISGHIEPGELLKVGGLKPLLVSVYGSHDTRPGATEHLKPKSISCCRLSSSLYSVTLLFSDFSTPLSSLNLNQCVFYGDLCRCL